MLSAVIKIGEFVIIAPVRRAISRGTQLTDNKLLLVSNSNGKESFHAPAGASQQPSNLHLDPMCVYQAQGLDGATFR